MPDLEAPTPQAFLERAVQDARFGMDADRKKDRTNNKLYTKRQRSSAKNAPKLRNLRCLDQLADTLLGRLGLIADSPTDPWALGIGAFAPDRLKLLLMLCEVRQAVLDCASLLAANGEGLEHIRERLSWQLRLAESLGVQLERLSADFPRIQRAATSSQPLPDFVMSPILHFQERLSFWGPTDPERQLLEERFPALGFLSSYVEQLHVQAAGDNTVMTLGYLSSLLGDAAVWTTLQTASSLQAAGFGGNRGDAENMVAALAVPLQTCFAVARANLWALAETSGIRLSSVLAEPDDISKVFCEGFMKKKSTENRHLWQNRFFRLQAHYLLYYKTQQAAQQDKGRRMYSLGDVRFAEYAAQGKGASERTRINLHMNIIQVGKKVTRVIELRTPSREAAESWYEQLVRLVPASEEEYQQQQQALLGSGSQPQPGVCAAADEGIEQLSDLPADSPTHPQAEAAEDASDSEITAVEEEQAYAAEVQRQLELEERQAFEESEDVEEQEEVLDEGEEEEEVAVEVEEAEEPQQQIQVKPFSGRPPPPPSRPKPVVPAVASVLVSAEQQVPEPETAGDANRSRAVSKPPRPGPPPRHWSEKKPDVVTEEPEEQEEEEDEDGRQSEQQPQEEPVQQSTPQKPLRPLPKAPRRKPPPSVSHPRPAAAAAAQVPAAEEIAVVEASEQPTHSQERPQRVPEAEPVLTKAEEETHQDEEHEEDEEDEEDDTADSGDECAQTQPSAVAAQPLPPPPARPSSIPRPVRRPLPPTPPSRKLPVPKPQLASAQEQLQQEQEAEEKQLAPATDPEAESPKKAGFANQLSALIGGMGGVGGNPLLAAKLRRKELERQQSLAEQTSEEIHEQEDQAESEVAAAAECQEAVAEDAAALDLPVGWEVQYDEDGNAYFQHESGASQWEHPVTGECIQ